MFKKSLSVLFAACMVVLASPAAQAQKPSLGKVVLAQPSDGFLYMPVYVARAKGYFEDEGLQPEVVVFKGGATALAAVMGGNADVYVGLPAIGIHARMKGQDVKAFGAVMTQYASNMIIQGDIAKEAGLNENSTTAERLAALKGLRLGITGPGSSTDQLTRILAKDAGMEPDRDVTIVPIGGGAPMLAAFAQKRIDGFTLSSPTTDSAIVNNDAFMLFNMVAGDYEPLRDFLYICLISQQSWLQKNPEIATAVVRAVARGEQLLAENPEEAREAVRSFFEKTDPAVFDSAFAANLPAYPKTPRISATGMERNLDFIEAATGERPQVSIEDTFTNEFVTAAGY